MEKIIDKIPVWVLSLSVFGLFILIAVSIYLGRPFTIAGLDFGAIENSPKLTVSPSVDSSTPVLNNLPVGSIVAFYGKPESLSDTGWVLCDGGNLPKDSAIDFDADPVQGGKQLPDLRGRFIQGLSISENLFTHNNGLHSGGNDSVDLSHTHSWVSFRNKGWFSYNSNGHSARLDGWKNGIGNEGEGTYPLSRSSTSNADFYTAKAGPQSADNRPSYIKLHYIIRLY